MQPVNPQDRAGGRGGEGRDGGGGGSEGLYWFNMKIMCKWTGATSWCSLQFGFTVCVKSPGEILTQEMWYEKKREASVFASNRFSTLEFIVWPTRRAISYRSYWFPPNATGSCLTTTLAEPRAVSITTAWVKARFIVQTQQQQLAAGKNELKSIILIINTADVW